MEDQENVFIKDTSAVNDKNKEDTSAVKDKNKEDTSAVKDDNKQLSFTSKQQAYIEKIIADTQFEVEAKIKAQQEAKKIKAQQEQDDIDAIARGEFEKVLTSKEQELSNLLKSQTLDRQQIKVYGEMTEKLLKSKLEVLGVDVKNALDGLPGDPNDLEKLNWITKNKKLFTKSKQSGLLPKGKPNGLQTPEQETLPKIYVNM